MQETKTLHPQPPSCSRTRTTNIVSHDVLVVKSSSTSLRHYTTIHLSVKQGELAIQQQMTKVNRLRAMNFSIWRIFHYII